MVGKFKTAPKLANWINLCSIASKVAEDKVDNEATA